MRRYLISGLVVATELELPFADPADATASDIDVVIRRGDVPPAIDTPTAAGPFWTIDGEQCLFTVPGVMRCLIANGRDITFEPASGVDDADVTPFVMGTGFGVLLHQRGLMVLHAGSVVVGGKAVLFCGPSGAGKSTMVAALVQRGFPFVSDDVCIVDFDAHGTPLVRPDGRLLRLWGRVVDEFSLGERRLDAVRPSIAKFFVSPEASATSSHYEIGAVYRLRAARPSELPRIARANVAEAAVSLRSSAYRPRYVAAAGEHQRLFGQVTRMAGRVSVFDLWRAVDFNALPGTVTDLLSHWHDLGLVEAAT